MPAVYLGRVVVDGAGVMTVIDYSGRLELKGGTLRRRTSDAGMPADTPPAEYLISHRTAGSRYLWEGGVYYAL